MSSDPLIDAMVSVLALVPPGWKRQAVERLIRLVDVARDDRTPLALRRDLESAIGTEGTE